MREQIRLCYACSFYQNIKSFITKERSNNMMCIRLVERFRMVGSTKDHLTENILNFSI